MARNLNVAVQPAAADACWPTSKMDFRSNEAGWSAPWDRTRRSVVPIPARSYPVFRRRHRSWSQELRHAR